jgi:hypothetical protein
MKKNSIGTPLPIMSAALVAGALLLFAGCEKENKTEENKCAFCGVGNPLEDLVWLKTMADTFSQHKESRSSIRICKYDTDKEGFIIADCENCPDVGVSLFACDGTLLCDFFGLSGKPCKHHAIDTSSIILIYKNY